ncbi:GNAT family N-acetyltransferase [Bifidobacterium aemilianum]|uniref:GNAT family N-acetyltransferase n=1 Tax=Bifidobacterium aemilianum TaxID=2493120 RepID=A0A366K8S5_9BIFI|nr:GNAT family N-acetyltransferase [Bifidobacterium aemilianum]RBP98116.1 GNAT family N-acetyltransferase [Bifidobacterium aemilianum]
MTTADKDVSVEVRSAQADDIDGIHSLLRQTLQLHHSLRPDLFHPDGAKYDKGDLARILEDFDRPVFAAVAPHSGKVLGYAFTRLVQDSGNRAMNPLWTLYLDDLCVDKAARGRHLGQALFRHVREYAASIGCYNLTLNVWEGNEQALGFYRALGLKPQKTTMEMLL